MRARARPYWLPKAGNSADEYEDAFWPERPVEREVSRFRCAVADGATETSFSGLWAGMLVRAWGRGRLGRRNLESALPALQRSWLDQVGARPLPWYAEEKLRSGAFAALLGLALREGRDGEPNTWNALAVGDSCLFQVRDGTCLMSFPVSSAEELGSRPFLLSSRPAGAPRGGTGDQTQGIAGVVPAHLLDQLRTVSGTWCTGDIFYLMTDALAAWFLRSTRSDSHAALGGCAGLGGDDAFADWIGALRAAGCIRNDDITLLRVDTG